MRQQTEKPRGRIEPSAEFVEVTWDPRSVDGTGIKPAGFVYVAWHPERTGYTKIGFTLWHPRLACSKYPKGIKRLHRIENYLEAFGFGPLKDWCSNFHPHAEIFEQQVRYELRERKRRDVGRNQEVYDIDPHELISIIKAKFNAQTY